MKQFYYMLGIGTVLVWGLMLLVTWTPGVQAQIDPNAHAAPNAVYLPLVASSAGATKGKSGIHLGNRGSDWQAAFLQHLQPPPIGDATNQWPAAVVIQSNQVYDIFRPDGIGPSNAPNTGPKPCWVNRAAVKQNNSQDYAVYDYLTRAIQKGTRVVIGISPSPGNFLDYANPGLASHTLLTTTIAGGDYCGDPETQKHKVEKFRDVYDLAAEMNAIYQVNQAHNWPADHVYFEPADQPNKEWYVDVKPIAGTTFIPNVDNKQAWIEMDNYFAALYGQAKQLNHDLQILTPPMAQRLYGEHFGLGTCDTWKVQDGGQHSGFDFMKQTYGYNYATINQVPAKADGFSLHNYWQAGQETWDTNGGVSFDTYCDYEDNGIDNFHVISDHITQYFPYGMAVTMRQSGKPMLMTEADLVAPCPQATTSLIRKETLSGDLIDYASLASDSLTTFIQQEFGARYVIAWLLVNEYEGNTDCDTNGEINWHEAYRENGQPRGWFTLWWPVTP